MSAKTSGAALTGLICGVLGIAACGLIGIVSLFTYPVVRSQYRQGQCDRSSLTMATVGLWLGIGALVLNLAIIALMAGIGNL